MKESYQEGPAAVEEALSDWRDAGGVKLPYKKTIVQNGKHFADITIAEYQINGGIKAEDLSRKP